jgi:pimeloyl-ACP methyl ester carboxylesterase
MTTITTADGLAVPLAEQGDGRITGLVLIDAVGIEVPGRPMTDFFALDARGVAEYTWHDSDRFYSDPEALTDATREAQAADMATLRVYAGEPYMHDPKLAGRLDRVRVPALAIWGDSDRIVTPEYGRAYAAELPNCRFELIGDAGHLPHIEQPEATFAVLDRHLGRTVPW